MVDFRQVGPAIRALRVAAGLSQARLQELAGLGKGTGLSKIESGSNMELASLCSLLNGLHANLHDLADAMGQPCRHHLVASALPSPPLSEADHERGIAEAAAVESGMPSEDLAAIRVLHRAFGLILSGRHR